MKYSLELNSHSLSYFQQCEQLYRFAEIDLLTPKTPYYPFKKGEGISRFLAIWYRAKRLKYTDKRLRALEFKLFKFMMQCNYFNNTIEYINVKNKERSYAVLNDDNIHIASRLMAYFNKYRDEQYPIISVEEGFSKILHEDRYVRFSYSGRPDVTLDYGPDLGIGPMDHKSESRANDIFKFNNQFRGYSWALASPANGNGSNGKLASHFGVINYIGLQKDFADGDVLRRDIFTFTQSQIDKWQSDTIEWYYRIWFAIRNDKFIRSWRCQDQYGVCRYAKLCTASSKNEELIHIKQDYKKLEKPYRSW